VHRDACSRACRSRGEGGRPAGVCRSDTSSSPPLKTLGLQRGFWRVAATLGPPAPGAVGGHLCRSVGLAHSHTSRTSRGAGSGLRVLQETCHEAYALRAPRRVFRRPLHMLRYSYIRKALDGIRQKSCHEPGCAPLQPITFCYSLFRPAPRLAMPTKTRVGAHTREATPTDTRKPVARGFGARVEKCVLRATRGTAGKKRAKPGRRAGGSRMRGAGCVSLATYGAEGKARATKPGRIGETRSRTRVVFPVPRDARVQQCGIRAT